MAVTDIPTLALDAAELAARARESRREHQLRRARITGVAIEVASLMRDGRPRSPRGD